VCDFTGKALGISDYGGIVWMKSLHSCWYYFLPDGLAMFAVLAFALFRFFDIVKPEPIRHFDNNWHGGLGVMFDDLLAAGYTLLCLALVRSACRKCAALLALPCCAQAGQAPTHQCQIPWNATSWLPTLIRSRRIPRNR